MVLENNSTTENFSHILKIKKMYREKLVLRTKKKIKEYIFKNFVIPFKATKH